MPYPKDHGGMVLSATIDMYAFATVSLRACEGGDIEAALPDALLACADLVLDPEVIALQRMILADSDKFPDIPETFYIKAMRRSVAALAEWLLVQHKRGLIVLDDVEAAAGMLLGMLVFQPQRDVMFGHKPPPTRGQAGSPGTSGAAGAGVAVGDRQHLGDVGA